MSLSAGCSTWAEFPPHVLREYALIADGRRGALCGPRGDLVWLCVPRWDAPAVLSALIGGEGVFAVTPAESCVWGGYYEPGTLIWRHRWTTPTTRVECRDALALPADEHRAIVLRRIEAIEHDVTVRVVLDVGAEFGQCRMREVRREDNGVWSARSGGIRVRLHGAPGARIESGRLTAEITVPAGRRHDLVLELSEHELPAAPRPDVLWRETEGGWRTATQAIGQQVSNRDARHAYTVLHGLTTPGGGMVAAATLGLPERAEQGRNYDYRYVWLRDQIYAGLAAAVDQPLPLFDDAVGVVVARLLEHGPDLAPAYRVDGTPLPEESVLDLPGYPGGTVVVGNWINAQFQLDTVGEILQILGMAAGLGRLDTDGHKAMELAVGIIEERWTKPDAGIWELDKAWWTHSRLACVAGLTTAAASAPPTRAGRLTSLAEGILAETTRMCLHPTGRWQRSPDQTAVDAALVLPPVRGALPAGDERTIRTLRAVEQDLLADGYVYRFAPSDRPLGEDEGAFLLCGFMMALAHWQQGHHVDANRFFERTRAACGPPGLYAEEYDVQQRQLRGNLPEAFVHALLLETAQRLQAGSAQRR